MNIKLENLDKEFKAAWLALFVGAFMGGFFTQSGPLPVPPNMVQFAREIGDGITLIEETMVAAVANVSPSAPVKIIYAQDIAEPESDAFLSWLVEANDILSRTNEEMLKLYASSGERLVAALAFNVEAAELIVDSNLEKLADYLASTPTYRTSISVGELGDTAPLTAAAIESAEGWWNGAVEFVAGLLGLSSEIVEEKLSLDT